MTKTSAPPIALAPESAPSWMAEAIVSGGGRIAPIAEAVGLIWGNALSAEGLPELLSSAPAVEWVQLPYAGVERFIHLMNDGRTWACGKGVYAEPVAELALGLAIAGRRGIIDFARASKWERPRGRNLLGSNLTILGGGGITESLLRLLGPFGARITVVRNQTAPMNGAETVVSPDRLHEAITNATVVFLALALTPRTTGIIGAAELALFSKDTWLVNVARGKHIQTDALIQALRNESIGGAALDVTDPEPLPADHPLWSLSNCIITPHVGNTPEMARPLLADRLRTNVRRYVRGESLIGLVDTKLGY